MKKRIFSILLVCCMVLALLPTTALAENGGGVAVDHINFPDSMFRTFIQTSLDINHDGVLSEEEIAATVTIDCTYRPIQDLTGIEHFTAMKTLRCHNTHLISLDVSKNAALEELDCSETPLTSLNVSKNANLRSLACMRTKLSSLDVSHNVNLKSLNTEQTPLGTLDVTKNTALEFLNCFGNNLTTIDVSENTALVTLYCASNQLTEIDVTGNTALQHLDFGQNNLTSIDLTRNVNLLTVSYNQNPVTTLDVSRNTALKELHCTFTPLTSLDISKNTALEKLNCLGVQLTELDVRQNTALERLECNKNQLTTLDVSQNVNLELFICTGNAYPIAVGENRTFALSTLPEGFEIEKAGNWTGGTVSDGILTVDEGATEVTYAYDCGSSKPVTFKLTLTDGCTVTFDTDGGSAVESQTVVSGQKAVRPADPARTGYTFAGWYLDGEVYDFDTPVTTDLTLTAHWTANQYTITFDTAGGSEIAPITQDYGTPITAPADPTREGYTFAGWDKAIPATMPAENMTITAQWTVNQYTITFDTAGGSAIASITQDYGTPITAPAAPIRTGYTFAGWSPALPATMPAENMTVTAQWTVNQYTITYDLDRGTADDNPTGYTVETETFTLKNPTRPGYIFSGWSGTGLTGEDNLTVTIPKGSTGNRSYTAHWRYNGGYRYYTIKATAGAGGSISPSGNVSVREGSDRTFTITPDKGYAVANVKIDGKSIGAVRSYTFENVRHAHTIEVSFMKAGGNPQTGVFVDVATGSYYEDAVDWAVENGITTGVSANRFDPNGVCTRAQAVTFLWRAAGSPKPETRTMPFTDVPAGSYYYDAVLWAVENGITKGTSDTTFSPNMTCSRAQIVAFLWRSEKSPAAGTANPFADVKSTAYYADAVLWAVKEDITKGTTNTTFSPDADCTRAQIVTFLWRCKK